MLSANLQVITELLASKPISQGLLKKLEKVPTALMDLIGTIGPIKDAGLKVSLASRRKITEGKTNEEALEKITI